MASSLSPLRILFFCFLFVQSHVQAQQLSGRIQDEKGDVLPTVTVFNKTQKLYTRSDDQGSFTIPAAIGDSIQYRFYGYHSLTLAVSAQDLEGGVTVVLESEILQLSEALVTAKKLEQFDVGFLPAIRGVQITTGTNSVIELQQLSGAKSTANPREIFAKIPGLNIWENDGAGIQIGIGGRGLSPDRAANFNTRQNGYDISADALGYPESYYTPPFEALKSIEIVRGSAALQFGTQFGGLLNFVIRDIPRNTPFQFTSRLTGGMYGYLGTFNRATGTVGKFGYQVYHQYKRGDGYRDNSQFQQHQAFAQLSWFVTEKATLSVEYTHMNYTARQAGGLTDYLFNQDPKQSVRDRNWFMVNWNLLAVRFNQEIGRNGLFDLRVFGMLSTRNSLGFLGKINQADPMTNRQLINGEFRNTGAEARYIHKYRIGASGNLRGAVLVGGRYYRGSTLSNQGNASSGDDASFEFLHPDNLEGSAFSFPSQNIAGFAENILFIGSKASVNFGIRMEGIESQANGYYKRYNIHPLNNDTLAIYTIYDSNLVKRSVPLLGAGGALKVGKRSSIYANFTQNYRAINFNDIRITNPNIVVDSAIRDEYGFTSELGYRGLFKDFWVYDLAGFYLYYGDKIGLAPKAGTVYKERTNIGDAVNYGVELFTEIDFIQAFKDSSKQHLSLFVNAAYIHAEYIRSKEKSYAHKQVEYVSPFILRSGIKWRNDRFMVQLQGSYTYEQYSDATNSIEPSGDAVIGLIPSYFVMDFSASWNVAPSWKLEMGVNNLTNTQYFTRRATGYPGPGILPSDGIFGYLTAQYFFEAKRK